LLLELAVVLGDTRVEQSHVREQIRNHAPGKQWNGFRGGGGLAPYGLCTGREHHAKLRQQASNAINDRGALGNEALARSM
jgi:hypothetical protein